MLLFRHMQADRTLLPGATPPVFGWFLGRLVQWTLLVCLCALPLFLTMLPRSTPPEIVAQVAGVLALTLVMIVVAEQLRWPVGDDTGALAAIARSRWSNRDADRRSSMLRSGVIVTALIHAALAIFAAPYGLFVWFFPAVWVASTFGLIVDEFPSVWNVFVLTLLCGAQAAACAWLSGLAVEAVSQAYNRPAH